MSSDLIERIFETELNNARLSPLPRIQCLPTISAIETFASALKSLSPLPRIQYLPTCRSWAYPRATSSTS